MDYDAALVEQNRLFAETIFSVDPGTSVPTCPGWSILQLMRHVGRGDRWAAQIIATRSGVDLDPRTVPDGRPSENPDDARAWLAHGPQVLFDAVADLGDPEVPVATFVGPRPARWWVRRRLHEATVHRADAAIAAEQRYKLSPELGADGVDEWLERLVDLPWRGDVALDTDKALAITAEDIPVSWTVVGRPDGIQLNRGSADPSADVHLSGPATNLLLALMRRGRAEEIGCSVDGDLGTWDTWLARTPF